MRKTENLLKLCKKFVNDNHIHCAETIYQMDEVVSNSLELIEQICEIVGYVKLPDDDEE